MVIDINRNKRSSLPVVFDMTSNQCIWSAAGVVPYRLCHNAFDCTSCSFDRKMQRDLADVKADRVGWRDNMLGDAAGRPRECRHMLSGYVSHKHCAHNYQCRDCEYDQFIEDEVRSRRSEEPLVEVVAGFGLAPSYYYHGGHAWARVEYGGQVRVGMDDFSARLFGPADSWHLPDLGAGVGLEETVAVMERDGHLARLESPVEGIVVAVNPELGGNPGLVNESPLGGGWLYMVQPTRIIPDLRALMFGPEAETWLEEEAARLVEMVEEETPYRLAATGGRAVADIFGSVPGLNWDQLAGEFLVR